MNLTKNKSLNAIRDLYTKIPNLKTTKEGSDEYCLWKHKTDNVIKQIFGENSSEYKSIHNCLFPMLVGNHGIQMDYHKAYLNRLDFLLAQLKGFEAAIELWEDEDCRQGADEVQILIKILSRFHEFARQINNRYNKRKTVEIKDEYDVQDLLHAILKLHFEDVRPEEYQPSYAGSSTRVDFFLKMKM